MARETIKGPRQRLTKEAQEWGSLRRCRAGMIWVIKPLIISLYTGWFLRAVSSLCPLGVPSPCSIDLYSPFYSALFVSFPKSNRWDWRGLTELEIGSLLKCESLSLTVWFIARVLGAAPVCLYLFIKLYRFTHIFMFQFLHMWNH